MDKIFLYFIWYKISFFLFFLFFYEFETKLGMCVFFLHPTAR